MMRLWCLCFFFFQAEDGIRAYKVTGVQTCALPILYPIPLDLATLGVQPDVSYLWRDDPPPRYPIVFLHDRNASIAEHVEGTERSEERRVGKECIGRAWRCHSQKS